MDKDKKTIYRVGIITIIWNTLLSFSKVLSGLFVKSNSLVSDGIHSASDVFSTIIVIIGARISHEEADKEHPFGHERLESVASMILAMLLGSTGLILIYSSIITIINIIKGSYESNNSFIILAFISAIGSIVIKFIMFIYTLNAANRIKSTSLKADAYHHLSDSLSSIGSVLGIVGLMIGGKWYLLDPIASIIIAIVIINVAVNIGKDAINQVVDKSAPESFVKNIESIILNNSQVRKINSLKTRQFGNKYYIEIEIVVDGNITVREGHDIAKEIHDRIELSNSDIKHCMIHIDPDK